MNKKIIPFHKPFPLSHTEIENLGYDIKQIIKSGQLSNSIYVKVLEEYIKELYNVKYAIATSSCSIGLMICLQFIDPMFYIQVPMFTWKSISHILKIMRKHVAWNDVDLKTWLPIEAYGGYSLYLNTFGNMGKSKRENTIYDSSHCLGAKIDHIGLAHVFSLAPSKLVTSCEGGIIITNNEEFYNYAKEQRDKISRMSEIHALIGSVYLEYLDEMLEWKKKVYNYYKKYIPCQFQEIPNNSSYNTIGFLNYENLQIPTHITIKKYYEPIWDSGIENNSKHIHKNIIVLPSYYNCDYEKIVDDILEYNYL